MSVDQKMAITNVMSVDKISLLIVSSETYKEGIRKFVLIYILSKNTKMLSVSDDQKMAITSMNSPKKS